MEKMVWSNLAQLAALGVVLNPGGDEVESGSIVLFAGPTPPAGYLLCDGAAVSRLSYSQLFGVLGEIWGPGDGSTTFNLPDLRDRFPVGAGTTYALADLGGAAQVNLAAGQLAAHVHSITDPGHVHGPNTGPDFTVDAHQTQATTGIDVTIDDGHDFLTASASTGITATDSASTGITATDSQGDADPVDIIPPFAAVVFLVKT